MTVNSPDKNLLTRRQAAEFLGFKVQTLAVWAHYGRGPLFHKVGRTVRYRFTDLEAFLGQPRQGTSEQK